MKGVLNGTLKEGLILATHSGGVVSPVPFGAASTLLTTMGSPSDTGTFSLNSAARKEENVAAIWNVVFRELYLSLTKRFPLLA